MCRVDDAEPATLWYSRERTASKDWKCCECYRRIAGGERYREFNSLYDGHWRRDRTCFHCYAAGDWLEETCGGYLGTEMLEELIEHWYEGYKSVAFGRLIAGMKQKWHDGRDPIPTGVRELAAEMMHRRVR